MCTASSGFDWVCDDVQSLLFSNCVDNAALGFVVSVLALCSPLPVVFGIPLPLIAIVSRHHRRINAPILCASHGCLQDTPPALCPLRGAGAGISVFQCYERF